MNADKRRKLLDLEAMRRQLPRVSRRGLSSTLKDIRKHGLPELDDRRDLLAARELLINERTAYGPSGVDKEVPTTGRGHHENLHGQPTCFDVFVFFNCAPFAGFVEQRFDACPPTLDKPWNVILYCDEVHPGDQIGGKNLRNFQAIYVPSRSLESLLYRTKTCGLQLLLCVPKW